VPSSLAQCEGRSDGSFAHGDQLDTVESILGDFKNCLHFIAMNGFVLDTPDVDIEAGIDDVGLEAKDVTRYCKADPAPINIILYTLSKEAFLENYLMQMWVYRSEVECSGVTS
jgi:hypothetical protein